MILTALRMHCPRPDQSLKLGVAAATLVIVVSMAGPRAATLAAQPLEQTPAGAGMAVPPIPLSLAPEGSLVVLAAHPAAIAARSPEFHQLAERLEQFVPSGGAPAPPSQDVAEVLVAYYRPDTIETARVVRRFVSPERCDEYFSELQSGMEKAPGAELPTWRSRRQRVVRFDRHTLAFDIHNSGEQPEDIALVSEPPEWSEEWDQQNGLVKFCLYNGSLLSFDTERIAERVIGGLPWPSTAALLTLPHHVIGSAAVSDEKISLTANAQMPSNQSAELLPRPIRETLRLAKEGLQTRQDSLPALQPDSTTATEVLLSLIDGTSVSTIRDRVEITCRLEMPSTQVAAVAAKSLPTADSLRARASQHSRMRSLKRLAVALQSYESSRGRLPKASSHDYYDDTTHTWKTSDHPHSWRVALLPFLDQHALYEAYHFDELWDSEANLQVARMVVPEFADPSSPSSNAAGYFLPVGPDTLFPPDRELRYSNMTDGYTKTILIVEAKRDFPWTKPEDIEIPEQGPLPKFGGHYDDLFLIMTPSGRGLFLPSSTPDSTLRSALTPDGGEEFEWPSDSPTAGGNR